MLSRSLALGPLLPELAATPRRAALLPCVSRSRRHLGLVVGHDHVARAAKRLCAAVIHARELCAVANLNNATIATTPATVSGTSGSANKTAGANGTATHPSGYRMPPQEIAEIVDAPAQPALAYSPDRSKFLQRTLPSSLPPITEMSRPELKLAGLRIDPELYARSKMGHSLDIAIVPSDVMVPAGPEHCVHVTGYPPGSLLNYISWSPHGKSIAFAVRSSGEQGSPPRQPLQLWVAHIQDDGGAHACQLLASDTRQGLNTVLDDYSWLDDDTLIACALPEGLEPAPQRPPQPPGPRIQDNSSGRRSQHRTYPDLLKDTYDVALFEHYCTSELISINVHTGEKTKIGPARVYTEVDVSPDGQFLLVSWIEPPYSFNVPCGRFPTRVQLWRRDGSMVRELAYLPLAEDIPIAFNSTRKGPRGINWRGDQPCSVYWIETQDGGDPSVDVNPRDIVYSLDARQAATNSSSGDCNGFQEPLEMARTALRCVGVSWCDDDLAIVYESWWKTRRSVWTMFAPGNPSQPPQVLFDRNYEDVYTDPGTPLSRRTEWGTYILAKLDGERKLLMEGTGATPEGNKPFLDLLDLATGESRRLWQSKPPFYEQLGSLFNDVKPGPVTLEGLQLIFTRETAKDPPQTYIMTLHDNANRITERQVTNYPHPYPSLRDMQRQVLRYPRADGIMLTATLYTPPGYDPVRDGRLPAIVWAYPREFKSKDAAGQMRKSPYQFSSIGSMSPTLWVARGYAVLDGPTLPIVAEGEEEPNDTFLQQLTSGAKAAVDEGYRLGVVDTTRVAVGGHSYGAFMAANLVAHVPDVFACAIARTGAYNRTLTPFGFQSEERTLWQAPQTYERMSPFMAADKIKKPILLIHGEDDNNPGTFPLQSERFYQALKGHGATCRLVLLPHESHGYRARESVMHCLYESDQWLERYAGFGRVDPDYNTESNSDAGSDSS